jgi:hypothetical protein
MKKTVYAFPVAFASEEELENLNPDPSALVQTVLPNGQPSYKTFFCSAFTEEEATRIAEAYVSRTSYKDIEDGKLVE